MTDPDKNFNAVSAELRDISARLRRLGGIPLNAFIVFWLGVLPVLAVLLSLVIRGWLS